MFASSTRLVGSLAPRGLLRVKGAKTLGKKRVSWDCAFSLQYPTHVGGEGQGGQAQQGQTQGQAQTQGGQTSGGGRPQTNPPQSGGEGVGRGAAVGIAALAAEVLASIIYVVTKDDDNVNQGINVIDARVISPMS